MAASWKLNMNSLPLRNLLCKIIPRSAYHYGPVTPVDGLSASGHSPSPSRLGRLQDQLSPRVLWRNLSLITCIVLCLNTLRFYAQEQLNLSRLRTTQAVDWSQYAYCQYVTSEDYLCNSVMIFESLHRLRSQASRVMMYPQEWQVEDSSHRGRLLRKARDEYGVDLQPVQLQHGSGELTWADSFTKLLAFNQTRYKRVLSLDSDATVLQPMDELFLLPSAPAAMPRAYWLENEHNTLSSQLILIEPSTLEMSRLASAIAHRNTTDFDMELVNKLYGRNCIVIPHRRYGLLTGEFRKKDHSAYLGSESEVWDAESVYREAKFLHFSDWPLPKPWVPASEWKMEEIAPACAERDDGRRDCRGRDIWFFAYHDFRTRRQRVCS